jgi:DNA polymerase I-like protein with 3'-5' exonuclease and polymerase domains
MKERGIKIDLSVVRKMKAELDVRKDQLFPVIQVEVGKKKKKLVDTFDAPFNPRSPVQAKKWFKEHGVILADTSKEEIEKALERSSLDVDNAVRVWLERLYDYKDTGKDLGAWFEEGKYIDAGFAHPRFIVCGSSLGRLASSGPNFQNIPRVGWGRGIRAAIVPRDPALKLVKADSSQLEFRMCAWHAGVQESPEKVFEWLQESFPTVITNRDRAKSVVHAADYGEGVKIVGTVKGKVQAEVDAGCRILHRDWEYGGGWMSFTGINLARRLLGTASRENRVAVLAVQKAYFHRFPELRSWQKRVSQEAENKVIKSSYTGRRIELIGDAETNFKVALAKYGQGDSADYNQEGMQRFYGRGWTPLLQAHDEIVLEVPREMGDNDSRELMQLMAKPSTLFPGFQCPVKVSVGENWLETRSVE